MRLHRTGPCSLQMGEIQIQVLEYLYSPIRATSFNFRKV